MLYSIGYEGMKSVSLLVEKLKRKQITTLIDVRSKPFSRKPGFSKTALKTALEKAGLFYKWLGKDLGGFRKIDEEHIRALALWQKERKACLMCLERNPAECHRDYVIAKRLKKYDVEVHHILTGT